GEAHPMKLKQELGRRIVADFHGPAAADHAAQDWSRMFQKDETPDDLPLVTVKFAEVAAPNAILPGSTAGAPISGASTAGALPLSPSLGDRVGSDNVMVQVRLDKLLAAAGLATSVSDGSRKIKQ